MKCFTVTPVLFYYFIFYPFLFYKFFGILFLFLEIMLHFVINVLCLSMVVTCIMHMSCW